MLVLNQRIIISNLIPSSIHVHSDQRNGGRRPKHIIVSNKEEEDAGKRRPEKSQQGEDPKKFPINKTLAQIGIGVLSLGFIDAGYSGDWSRIGVISKEAEDLLKAAAFLVAPLCAYLIYAVSQEPDAQ